MDTAQIREELHQFINHADERILNLIYTWTARENYYHYEMDASEQKNIRQILNF